MKPRYPIYIPSKGRANRPHTIKMLEQDGVDFKIVVQPDQVAGYSRFGMERLLVLPEDNKGLVYARNWITEHSVAQGDKRHWQLDDDIRFIYRTNKGRRLKCNSGVAFRVVEDFVDRYENVALASLNDGGAFLPVAKGYSIRYIPPFYLNHRCYTDILFLNSLPNRWRPPNNEDTDMTLQVLADGWCTILFNAFAIDTETTMQASGGQTEAFRAGARLEMVRALERKWPGVVKIGRRFGHPQHFIRHNWTRFDTQLKLREDIDLSSLPEIDNYGLELRAIKPVKSDALRRLLEEERRNA